jgi:uncharacterized membrane-anchored protein
MRTLPFRLKFRLAVGLQLLLLLALLGFHQFTLLTGQHIWLKTRPVDPRDMFRGDYVALRYDISTIPGSQVQSASFDRGSNIYVTLKRDGRYWTVDQASTWPPEGGQLFLRGKVRYSSSAHTANTMPDLDVEYGIESYFVPEGQGQVYQRLRSGSLAVEVAVDRTGRAAIRRVEILPSDTKQ